ncbi:MAG TPA: peptide deformylase [Xanthomonadales bacterium]|nr:peptide deformylase [Xanthomonadales bacterium]
MATLEILEFPDPRLRTVAKAVTEYGPALQQLARDMTETMYAENGIGLAATQVNVHKQLLVLDVSESRDQLKVYVNPEILSSNGEQNCEEGCLSVPGVYAEVKRAEKVRVRAFDVSGKAFEEELEGLHAICLQHEMDHLQGKLFVDYLSPLKRQMVRKKLEKAKKQADKKPVAVM